MRKISLVLTCGVRQAMYRKLSHVSLCKKTRHELNSANDTSNRVWKKVATDLVRFARTCRHTETFHVLRSTTLASTSCRYDGYESGTGLFSYSWIMTLWDPESTSSSSPTSPPTFEESDITNGASVVDLSSPALADLVITFVNSTGLVTGDTWTILISSCGADNPLNAAASATLTSEDGTAEVNQLTLDRGYEGSVAGSQEVYSVNQHFTVRGSGGEQNSVEREADEMGKTNCAILVH